MPIVTLKTNLWYDPFLQYPGSGGVPTLSNMLLSTEVQPDGTGEVVITKVLDNVIGSVATRPFDILTPNTVYTLIWESFHNTNNDIEVFWRPNGPGSAVGEVSISAGKLTGSLNQWVQRRYIFATTATATVPTAALFVLFDNTADPNSQYRVKNVALFQGVDTGTEPFSGDSPNASWEGAPYRSHSLLRRFIPTLEAVDPPCSWPVTQICADDESEVCEHLAALSDRAQERIRDMATDILWSATGRQYGLCEKTYRPCRRNCDGSYGYGFGTPFLPWRIDGQWINIGCNRCSGDCGCGTISEVRIPNVEEIVNIRIDGVDLDPLTVAAVYDRNRIMRVDGNDWPACQNLTQKDGIGAWSITVLEGRPVPSGGASSAGLLACELAKACEGLDGCRLPRRIQTLTRQGVTVGFQDKFEGLENLRTGIYEIDLWVESARRARWGQPSIASVDRPRPSEMTWPVGV